MEKLLKKIVVFTMLIASIGTVAAQSHYYHLEGDTVRGRCPIYYYSWWPNTNANGQVDSVVANFTYSARCMRHIADSTLRIVGIASTLTYIDHVTFADEIDPTLAPTMYYALYKATPNKPVELARIDFVADYATHPKRYMELPRTQGSSCDSLEASTIITPLREYYFNTPITITDSFYLGYWIFTEKPRSPRAEIDWPVYLNYMCSHSIMNSALWVNSIVPQPCHLDIPAQKFLDSNIYPPALGWETLKTYSLVFPIIEVDTVGLPYDTAFFACNAAIKLQYAQLLETAIRITWNDTEHSEWEISVVAAGGVPDTGRITHTTSPQALYYGLSTDTAYDIYIRTHCRYGWSDWSHSLSYIPDGYHPGGIETASPVEFSLMPNPAKEMVAIEAPSPLQGTAEIIDLQGKTLMTVPLSGSRTMLDVSSLSAGSYLVHVSTAQGSSTKKLSLQ